MLNESCYLRSKGGLHLQTTPACRNPSLGVEERAADLRWQAFEIVSAQGVNVLQPGEFEILAGPSSRERDLLRAKKTH